MTSPTTLAAFKEREFHTVANAAKFLGVGPQTIYNAIASGELQARKYTPKLFRLRTVDVLRWAGIEEETDLPSADQPGGKN